MQRISNSELTTLLRCTKKHDYAYRQGLVQKEPPAYLSKGSFAHELLAMWFLDGHYNVGTANLRELSLAAQKRVLEERGYTISEPDRIEVITVLEPWLEAIAADTSWHVATTPEGEPIVEHEFTVDLGWKSLDGEPVLFHGIMDLGTRHEGGVWLHEHKTLSRMWSQQQFEMSYQPFLYAAAYERLFGEPVQGIQYNLILPKRVETRHIYSDTYKLDNIMAEVQAAIYLRDTNSIVRQPHWGCTDCWYRELCYPELVGQDTEVIRNLKYTVDADKVERFAVSE